MLKKIRSISLSKKIFTGMVLGIIAGLFFGESMEQFEFIGALWMNCLKVPIAPIVFVMLLLGIGRQTDARRLAGLSVGLIAYYIATTIMASFLAIGVTSLINPGADFIITGEASTLKAVEYTLSKFLLSLVPSSFLRPIVENTVLQVLFLGIIGGVAVLLLPDQTLKQKILDGCDCLQEFFNAILRLVLSIAPIGIFCFMGATVGVHGKETIFVMGKFMASLLLADGIQLLFYGVVVIFLLAGKNPITFYKNMLPTWVIAMTTASSVLCIPSNIHVCSEKYDVDPALSSFGIPLGAQLNTDGTAIFLPCVLVFASQALGIHYDLITLLYMALVSALIASTGGGVFGGALVKLIMLCQMFAVPDSIVTMVGGMFAIIDMFITTVNVTGDAAGVIFIDSAAKRLAPKRAVSSSEESLAAK
jgi:Na+/H+-dicarboxylate symporters